MSADALALEQIHIDIARNSTDDFNPFHDPLRWQNIKGNPFGSPIALGFQMEFLASDRVARFRESEDRPVAPAFPYRNFEFNFAGALRAGEPFVSDVRKTVDKTARGGGLSNRIVIRKTDGTPVLIGSQSDTPDPRFALEKPGTEEPRLSELCDRSFLNDSGVFLKRKFMTTSNAKNFALGALCRQHDYIDELSEKIFFAPLFTASLVSCALLERGTALQHDFEADPMVYTNHQISVDMALQRQVRSNDRLHILVDEPQSIPAAKGLGKVCVDQQRFTCLGMLGDHKPLFKASVQLAPLQAFLPG